MTINFLLALCIAAFILSLLFTALALRIAQRFSIIDHPNLRSSHTVPTPRGGGLSIVLIVLAASVFYPTLTHDTLLRYVLFAASGLVALVGLVDDIVSISAKVRIFFHFIAALLITGAAYFVLPETADEWFFGRPMPFLAWAIAIVWSLNLFNFMDGIDGIAASEAIFVGLAGSLFLTFSGATDLVVILLILASSSFGFLLFNWSPASIFLGDVASGFLGFVLASVALLSSVEGYLSPAVWIILGGGFLTDATYTLVIRLVSGQRWWQPHRLHVYQKLAARYDSHSKATILYVAVNVFWLLPMAWVAFSYPDFQWWVVVAALAPLTVGCIYFRGGMVGDGPA